MVKYSSERAWTILEDNVGAHFIILKFDGDRVHLSKWFHPISAKLIANIAPRLKTKLILPVEDIKRLDVVFEW